jgi:hypothetical protein
MASQKSGEIRGRNPGTVYPFPDFRRDFLAPLPLLRCNGQDRSFRRRRTTASRHPARQRTQNCLRRPRGSPRLPQLTPELRGGVPLEYLGLVPHDQPHSFAGSAADTYRTGPRPRPHSQRLRALSKRKIRKLRACLAGALLFLPSGRVGCVAGNGLRRMQSSARWVSGVGRRLSVVECARSHKGLRRERLFGNGSVASELHRSALARDVASRSGGRSAAGTPPIGPPDWQAIRFRRIRCRIRIGRAPAPGAQSRGPAKEIVSRCGDSRTAAARNRGMSILSPHLGMSILSPDF